jgi:hypothetical protein
MKSNVVVALFVLVLCACTQPKRVDANSSSSSEAPKSDIPKSPIPVTVTSSKPEPITSPNRTPSSIPSEIERIEISSKPKTSKGAIKKPSVKSSNTTGATPISNKTIKSTLDSEVESQIEAPLNIENFIARASAKKQMRIKEQTLLKIWIGPIEAAPVLEESEISKEMSLGKKPLYAKVEPYVSRKDDVSIQAIASTEEKNQAICAPIPDTGTDFVFTMTPLRRVTFEAGGNVFLFDTEGCTGTPRATKAASLITVEVKASSFIEDMKDLWDFSWSKIQDSIKELVSFFMLILVISFRKRIMKFFKIRKIPS